jgi:glycosyltransferase involved in cell wall biosynthesis
MSAKTVFTMTFAERLGGCERMLWTFLRLADRDRIEPMVVFNNEGSFPREVAASGIPTEVIVPGRLRDLPREAVAVSRLRTTFRREAPDLIVSWFTKAHLYAAPAAVLAGMRDRLVWFQHTLPGGTNLDRPATALPAKAIIATSEAGARAQRRIRPTRSTRVVLPGIEEPAATPPGELQALRGGLGIPPGRRIVGVVGRLQPWKQQHLAIEAVGRLRADGHDVHGLLVGGDAYDVAPEYEPSLKRLVVEKGLEEAITFAGHVDNAHPHMQLMDVVMNTSSNEPFGMVLLEAMALGLPVVAFDSDGGPREILENGRCGLLARSDDAGDLAAQTARLLGDDSLRLQMVGRGRDRFTERFTAEHMVRSLETTLVELAGSR